MLALTLGACGGKDQNEEELSVEEAWYRMPLPGKDKTSAYMKLENHSGQNMILRSAISDQVRTIEIHEIGEESGMFTMRRIKALEIPARQQIELKPGGLHLMLFGVDSELQPGQAIEIELHYDGESTAADQTVALQTQKVVFLAVDPKEANAKNH